MDPSPVCASCRGTILAEDSIIYLATERLLLHLACYESAPERIRPDTPESRPSAPDRAA